MFKAHCMPVTSLCLFFKAPQCLYSEWSELVTTHWLYAGGSGLAFAPVMLTCLSVCLPKHGQSRGESIRQPVTHLLLTPMTDSDQSTTDFRPFSILTFITSLSIHPSLGLIQRHLSIWTYRHQPICINAFKSC